MTNARPPRLIAPYIRLFRNLSEVSESLGQHCRCTSLRSAGVGALPTTAYEHAYLVCFPNLSVGSLITAGRYRDAIFPSVG
jgi:hypothetical protein